MTHIANKIPLEKSQGVVPPALHGLIVWVAAWLMAGEARIAITTALYRRRVRAAWRVLCGRQAYQGARYLPDEESIPWQCRMAAALGGSERALIVIRLSQWIDHNKSEGRDATTHNGYDAWVVKHFWHLKPGAFGGHIRALETMGVLKTQRIGQIDPTRRYDQRKSYRIDHARLNALIAAVKAPHLDTETSKSKTDTRKSKTDMAPSSLNNDSKSPDQSLKTKALPKSETQEPAKPGRGGRRVGAGRKGKAKEALTNTAPTSQSATAEPDSHSPNAAVDNPGQSNDSGQTDLVDGPHPSSAEPFSQIEPVEPSTAESRLVNRLVALCLEADRAAALIDAYGADRVRAVVFKCEQRLRPTSRETPIDRPAGWIIAELKNDIFKLGEMTETDELARPENWHKRLAADSCTDEDLETMTDGGMEDLARDAALLELLREENAAEREIEMPASVPVPPVSESELAEQRARDVWARVMNDLHEYCGQEANVIRRGVQLVAVDEDAFLVSTSDDQALSVLKREARTLKLRLSSIMGRECRIKHIETETAEVAT